MSSKEKKNKRPISRMFWNYLRFFPQWLQARIIRSKFEVDYNLPEELVFKQAETVEEIRQAFKLVHDSYVELNYMDRTESELRFSVFQALPTTVILVAKLGDDVVGTISIVPDSAVGLPVDMTWDLSKYRKNGKMIAEVTSLAIKKDFRMRRGKLLLPLCKIMFLYCEKIFKLDGIVIATTLEVEPFYLHVLLFEKVISKTGQKHSLVKGNPSTCCFLEINETLKEAYKSVYGRLEMHRNLYYYFVITETPNIHLPIKKAAIQSYNHKKNKASSVIIKREPSLMRDFTAKGRSVVRNLDVSKSILPPPETNSGIFNLPRAEVRFDVRFQVWCIFLGDNQCTEGQVIDISINGFRINLKKTERKTQVNDQFVVVFEFFGQLIHCTAKVKWVSMETRLGCELTENLLQWRHIMKEIHSELHSEIRSEIHAEIQSEIQQDSNNEVKKSA
jgi:hypothetical protein